MLHHPCILGDPQTKGGKIRIGYVLGGQKWAEMLHHAYILGGPQQRGQNQSTKKKQRKNLNFFFYCVLVPAWGHVAPTRD